MQQKYYRHELYDRMVEEWNIFENYVDLIIFAAAVGYTGSTKQRVNEYSKEEIKGLDSDRSGIIKWSSISNQQSYRVISASIAYQHTNEYEVITDPEKQLEIVTRYARAGILELADDFNDYTNPPRDGLISYIDNLSEDSNTDEDEPDVFGQIIDSFDEDIFS
jgi:hypothetical protein